MTTRHTIEGLINYIGEIEKDKAQLREVLKEVAAIDYSPPHLAHVISYSTVVKARNLLEGYNDA